MHVHACRLYFRKIAGVENALFIFHFNFFISSEHRFPTGATSSGTGWPKKRNDPPLTEIMDFENARNLS